MFLCQVTDDGGVFVCQIARDIVVLVCQIARDSVVFVCQLAKDDGVPSKEEPHEDLCLPGWTRFADPWLPLLHGWLRY